MAELLTDDIIIEKLNEDGIMQEPDGPWLTEYIYENYGGQLDTIRNILMFTDKHSYDVNGADIMYGNEFLKQIEE